MRQTVYLLLMILSAILVKADDYKILYVSTKTIKVGGKTLVKGSIFNDKSVIQWTQATQSMRIKRIQGKEVKIKIVTREMMKGLKYQTIAELDKQQSSPHSYFNQTVKKNHTSTRKAIKY